jgi:molybdopterin molybdotransferase
MHSVSEALSIILQNVQQRTAEPVALRNSLSRVLAETLFVPHDSPLFDKSLMDGFAVCVPTTEASAGHSEAQSVTFLVAEVVTAGNLPTVTLSEGVAARIMTGAPLPDGCNCVVPIEQTQFNEANPTTVTIPQSALRQESCLIRRGTSAAAGSVLLQKGTRLQPQQLAALAEFGFNRITVERRPTVAVLATGDELTSIDEPLMPGQIRNSNEPMLIAQIEACDAIPVALGIARDEEQQLRTGILQGLRNDFLLLTGGVSAGILDLVPQQLKLAGVTPILHGVHMKPGKPLWFGVFEQNSHRCLVFGLPGNPVSSLACFELFVRPALQTFSGLAVGAPLVATMEESAQVFGNRPVYHPARIQIQNGRLTVRRVPWSGSSDLKATVDANGMALFLPEHGLYSPGEMVEIWLWGDQRLL